MRTKRIKPRPLVSSQLIRATPRQHGGGRPRAALVAKARDSIAIGSKSFTVASWLFDKATRERAHLLYAWCRRCDDIADGQEYGFRDGNRPVELDEANAKDRVEAIRILTHRALDGQTTADIAFDALGQVAAEVGITRAMCDDVIDGFALDAEGWRPRTEGDLMRYCYHVAGAVGVMMAKVMGVPDDAEDTLDRACDLGLAFQLSNIARDICEDDAAGRCYLPMEWLAEMDIPPGQLMKPAYREQLVLLAGRLVGIGQVHEASARIGAGRLRFRQRWAIFSAANIYGAIGEDVVRLGASAWDHRVHTSLPAKLGDVAKALKETIAGSYEPKLEPKWTRGQLMVMARIAGPVAGVPNTPIRDESVRRKED